MSRDNAIKLFEETTIRMIAKKSAKRLVEQAYFTAEIKQMFTIEMEGEK